MKQTIYLTGIRKQRIGDKASNLFRQLPITCPENR